MSEGFHKGSIRASGKTELNYELVKARLAKRVRVTGKESKGYWQYVLDNSQSNNSK